MGLCTAVGKIAKVVFHFAIVAVSLVGIILHMVGGIGIFNVDLETAQKDGLSSTLSSFISCHDIRSITNQGEELDNLVGDTCQRRQAGIVYVAVFASMFFLIHFILTHIYLWKGYRSLERTVRISNFTAFGLTALSLAGMLFIVQPSAALLLDCSQLSTTQINAIANGDVTTLPSGAACVIFEDHEDNLSTGEYFLSRYGIYIGGVVCSFLVQITLMIFLSLSVKQPKSPQAAFDGEPSPHSAPAVYAPPQPNNAANAPAAQPVNSTASAPLYPQNQTYQPYGQSHV